MKTIYLDIDEEITSLIDKLRKEKQSEIALVFPNGASLPQSLINLKLLKKQAQELGKKIIIVSTDRISQSLADQAGVKAVSKLDQIEKTKEEISGEGAKEKPGVITKEKEKEKEIIIEKKEVREPEPKAEEHTKEENKEELPKIRLDLKEKTGKKATRFSLLKKAVVGFLVLLLLLSIGGFIFLPRTNIKIKPKAEVFPLDIKFSADSKTEKPDLEKNILPAQIIEAIGENEKKFPATGKKDVGTKAGGVVNIYNDSTSEYNLAAGTQIQASNSDLIFITNSEEKAPITFRNSGGTPMAGTFGVLEVTAASTGEAYNLPASTYFFVKNISSLRGQNTAAFSGGTTKELTIVAQADINQAKTTLETELFERLKNDLNAKVEQNKQLVEEAVKKETEKFTTSAAAGNEVKEFNAKVSGKMSGLVFDKILVSEILNEALKKQTEKKEVIDNGLSGAIVKPENIDWALGKADFLLQAKSFLGEKVDYEGLKKKIRFKDLEEASKILKETPQIESFEIKNWPQFWPLLPILTNRIHIDIKFSDVKNSGN